MCYYHKIQQFKNDGLLKKTYLEVTFGVDFAMMTDLDDIDLSYDLQAHLVSRCVHKIDIISFICTFTHLSSNKIISFNIPRFCA